MSQIKFSIIIPTYKRELLLKEAINSALSQISDATFEVLIVDNNAECCSPSPAQLISESFNDDRVEYVRNERNLGAFGNMNKAIQLAKYEYIVLLHDDDLLKENYLSIVNLVLSSNHDVDMIFTDKKVFINGKEISKHGIFRIAKNTNILSKKKNKIIKIKPNDFFINNIVGCPVGTLFRKSKALEIGGFDENSYPISDYTFWTEYSLKNNVYMIAKELAISRQEDNITLSAGMYERLFRECYKFQKQLIERDIAGGFLAKAYLYESLKIRNSALLAKTGKGIDINACYIDATGKAYHTDILKIIRAYAYLIKFIIGITFRYQFKFITIPE